jgi:hypothetical protein
MKVDASSIVATDEGATPIRRQSNETLSAVTRVHKRKDRADRGPLVDRDPPPRLLGL